MNSIVQALRNFAKHHKKKAFAFLGFVLLFLFLLFPFGDLSNLVTSKVADATGNQVYLQFDDLGLSVLPKPSIELTNVLVESPFFPTLSAESLNMVPTMATVLGMGQGGSLYASGLFKGDLALSAATEKSTQDGMVMRVDLEADTLDMEPLSDFLGEMISFPLNLQGRLSLETDMVIDTSFAQQPKGPVQIQLNNFVLPSYNVNTMMGPLQTPNLKFGKITLKGKLNTEESRNGQLRIEEAVLGQEKDELFGRISGTLDLAFQKIGSQVVPSLNGYDLRVDLDVKSSLEGRAGLFFLLFQNAKTQTPTGNKYSFRISAPSINSPPKIEKAAAAP